MEPPESTGPDLVKYLAWFEVHKKRIALWAGAVVVLIAVIIGVVESRAHRERQASQVLSEVRGPRVLGEAPSPQVIEAYLRVAREYAGTKAAERALLLAAAGFYTANQFAEAQKHFESLLKRYPDSLWMAEAALGVAACLEAQGRTNDALSKYEEVRRRFGNSPVADDAKLALGRLYEGQGKHEDAYKLYDELAKARPVGRSGLAMEAQMRMQELARKHPELARPKQPPVSAAPTLTLGSTAAVATARVTSAPTPATNLLTTLTSRAPAATTGLLTALTNVQALTNLQRLTNLLARTNPPAALTNPAAIQPSPAAVLTNRTGTNQPVLPKPGPGTNR